MSQPAPNHPRDDAVAALVAQLMQTTGCLMLIVGHMSDLSAFEHVPPDSPEFDDFLEDVLREALEPLAELHPRSEIETAAALLEEALEIVSEGILVVPPDPPPCAQPRSRVRRRRPH